MDPGFAATPLADAAVRDTPAAGSLSHRSVRGGLWSVAEIGVSHALRLVSNLIMTRLLLPEAFGLMAMVVTLHVALTLFTDIGIQQSVVRSPNGTDSRFLRVAWVVQGLRGAAIAAIVVIVGAAVWLLAPVLATPGTVYADPALPLLVAVSALVVLVNGLGSTNQYLAERRMQLGLVALLNIASQIAAIAAMVLLVRIEATVWALFWGMFVGTAFKTLLSHMVFAGPRMGWDWDTAIAEELWGFGKWLLGASVFTFIAWNADRLILAALLDKTLFGFYVIAILWVQGFRQVVGSLTSRIGLSAFSEVQRARPGDIARVYRRFSRLIDALCLAGFAVFLFGGGLLMDLLYPAEYATAASFFPLLALGILQQRFGPLSSLMLSQGDGKAMLLTAGLAAVVICIALPAGYWFLGTEGAVLAAALSPLFGSIVLLVRAAPLLGKSIRIDIFWFAAICGIAGWVYLGAAPVSGPLQ